MSADLADLHREEIESLRKKRSLERHHRVRAEKKLAFAKAGLVCALSEPDKKLADRMIELALADIEKVEKTEAKDG